MEIEVGKYIMKSDNYCLWIEEKIENKKNTAKNKYRYVRVAGYCTSFASLMRSFTEKQVLGSDAESISELLTDLERIEAHIKAFEHAASEKDFRLVAKKYPQI